MDEELKQMLDAFGAKEGDPNENVAEGEEWDIFRFTQEVARLAAEHLRETAIVFAATRIDDDDPDHMGQMSMTVGGATPNHRCFGDMVSAIGGKIFNANYGTAAARRVTVTREHDDA